MRSILSLLLAGCLPLLAQIVTHDTLGTELPAKRRFEIVKQSDSPLQKLYVKTADGLYVAATLRKPKGNGPFPTMVVLHGSPGGRGMEQLENWSLGKCGGPVWEGLLQAGYAVVVGDYRGMIPKAEGPATDAPPIANAANAMAPDVLALIEHVRTLPFVDKDRIGVYGVSLGGDVALHVAARIPVRALILGAPAARVFLGAERYASGEKLDDYSKEAGPAINKELAARNIAALQSPTLIFVGTKDSLLPLTRTLYEQLDAAGKPVTMHVYRNGYHDFPMGPQCHDPVRFPQPFIDATEQSFALTLEWLKTTMK